MGNVDPGSPARMTAVRGEEMLQPEEVAAMMRLHALGWGAKRLSKEFGCARNRFGATFEPAARRRSGSPCANRLSTDWTTGCASAPSGTVAMLISCVKSWRAARWASSHLQQKRSRS